MELQPIPIQDVEKITPFVDGMATNGMLSQCSAEAIKKRLQDATKLPEKVKERLITAEEAASRLNVCRATIFRMYRRGQLTRICLKPGEFRSSRFRESEIEAIINGGESCNVNG